MRFGGRLPRAFFDRPAVEVAPELLGRVLARRLPDGSRLSARIVEVEAYEPGDPASHGFRGRTARNASMFGPPGHLYVFLTYGMHFCMNVVTRPAGQGSAVLLRAAEPLEGLEAMRARRGTDEIRRLCSGPARWAQAFGVDRELDGADLVRGREAWLHEGTPVPASGVAATRRVGVTAGVEREWRWVAAGDRFVSPGRPARAVPSDRVRGSRRS